MKCSRELYWVDKWFENVIFFRIVFFLVILLDLLFERLMHNFLGVYILIQVVGALAFQGVLLQVAISGFLSILRFVYMSPNSVYPENFLLNWFAFFCMAALIVSLIRRRREDKNHNLNMTFAFVKAIDSRDSYTAYHSQKVAHYAKMIAEQMRMNKYQCENIYLAGLLHDIGKIGVPEEILGKAAQLTDEEYETIKAHSQIGFRILEHSIVLKQKGVLDVVLHHHERFDGKGYPDGLIGVEIPLGARIIAVADTFDSMTSQRVYRDQLEISIAIEEIQKNRGIQFDPLVVDAFLAIIVKPEVVDCLNRMVETYPTVTENVVGQISED